MFLSLVLGSLMAAISFILNSWLIKRWGNKAFITSGPVIEEMSKSYLAWYLGANLILTHFTFGVIEGIYDFLGSRYGVKGSILSIGGHSFFGLVTATVYAACNMIGVAIIVSCLVHVGYNLWIIYHFANK